VVTLVPEDIRNFLLENLHVELSLQSPAFKTRRRLQHFLMLQPKNVLIPRYEMIMSHAVKAESMCPGAGLIFLKLLCGLTVDSSKDPPKNRYDVLKILSGLELSTMVEDMLLSVLNMSTLTTNISFKKAMGQQAYVELTNGYNFNISSLLRLTSTRIDVARVACIDGYVETVSELHHMFNALSEKKIPCLLFVRGLSDDVLHTIQVNNERKTMLVFPFVVPYDLDNVNTIVDIAIASNTDVVSSTKGQLISSIDYGNLGVATNCFISGNNIKFSNDSSRNRVYEHINQLKTKIAENHESNEFISRRLKPLSSLCIEIGIPEDINFYSTQQQLDEGIRTISSILKGDYKPVLYAEMILESYKKTISNLLYHSKI
jgi:hypothetical protein